MAVDIIASVCSTGPGHVKRLVKMFDRLVPAPTAIAARKSTAAAAAAGVSAERGANSVGGDHLAINNIHVNVAVVNVLIFNNRSSSLPTVTAFNGFMNNGGDMVARPFYYQLLCASGRGLSSDHGSPSDDTPSREFDYSKSFVSTFSQTNFVQTPSRSTKTKTKAVRKSHRLPTPGNVKLTLFTSVYMSGFPSSYSPKSSPRGARSPVVSRQDSTGTLKTTISLGKNPSIVHSGPFYLMKEPPCESELTGSVNLMAYYGLEHTYSKFSGKRLKESLSSFLPNLPGIIDTPGHNDQSSLRSVIEKPPIGGKEILPLTTHQLAGFRLHPGPLPEQYRYANQPPTKKHKNKHKKSKYKSGEALSQDMAANELGLGDIHEKKHKKQKRHDDDKERKKRKKEKKKKKQKHSPEHPGNMTPGQHSN